MTKESKPIRQIQIAVDGPAGAGKSTVAKTVARRLGLFYLDTGAMYRVIAYKALHNGIDIHSADKVSQMAQDTEVRLDHNDARRVWCDGVEVTGSIRTPEVSRAVPVVAAYPQVRKRLVSLQRQEAERGGVVMDGRDIGTYVLPDADLKIFLTATPEERARRRWKELKAAGKEVTLEEVMQDMIQRDSQDSQREMAPLKPAEDAQILDTTGLSLEQVINCIVEAALEGRN